MPHHIGMINWTQDQGDRAGRALKTQIESLEGDIRWTRGALENAKRNVESASTQLADQEAQLAALIAVLGALELKAGEEG